MKLRKDYINGEIVETIYFGGGTPSLLEPAELGAIMEGLRREFVIDPGAEVTLEANPDDINVERLRAWKAAGINRLSIGVQSFFEEDLRWMNRAHNAAQATASVRMAQEEGFDNISIDLIYGGPTLPDDHWKRNVAEAIRLGIAHLSCYALTVEPRTALDKMIRQHKLRDVDPEDQARQFLLLMEWAAGAGYEHYEISNFALPGRRSRHNSSYWQGKTYLGLGPSAHSYDGVSREWNVANNALYVTALKAAEEGTDALVRGRDTGGTWSPAEGLVSEREVLTPVQRLNEYIMISLRTMEGIDMGVVAERFGGEAAQKLVRRAERYINEGKMRSEGWLVLTQEGKLLADGIAADLFFSDAGGGSLNS